MDRLGPVGTDPAARIRIAHPKIETSGADGGIALLASIALVGTVAPAFESGGGGDRPLGRSAVVEAAPTGPIEARVSDRWLLEAGDVVEDAVEHVLENAIVRNDAADPAVRLGASAGARDDWVEISIADDGPGIPEQERRIVMGEADITQLRHGSGIGLWATRWLVQTIDGEIDIEDRESQGTIVRIRLPTVDGSA